MRDWLLGLELEPKKIGTYFQEGTTQKFSTSKIIGSLYESLNTNYDFFEGKNIQFNNFIDDCIELIEPDSSFYDYANGENFGELDLALVLRTLAQILRQSPYKDLFSDFKPH